VKGYEVVMDHRHSNSFAQMDSPLRLLISPRMERFCSPGFRFQALVSLALTLMILFGAAGCSTSQSAQPAQTPVISVALAQLPPTTLTTGNSVQVAATVTNDPANAGVDWIATCGSVQFCGSFSPAHTASGAATNFIAPTGVPSKKAVAVTALSATDHSKSASFSVNIVSTVTSTTITQLPPPSAPAGLSLPLSATVVGDPANMGVDWTVSFTAICSNGLTCGSVNFHTASGAPFTYNVPSSTQIATIVGTTITVTAYASADHSFSASAGLVVSPDITLTLTQQPPATMLAGASATLIAVTQNDPTNSGISWSTCGGCGTITPFQSASGAPVTFTAPTGVPLGTVVPINAQSTASPQDTLSFAGVNVTIVQPISVAFVENVKNGTIVQGHNATLIATTTNDIANAGIDWSVACGSPGPGNCGTFSLMHTASGASTTYAAPLSVPTGVTVTITAASTTDPTKMATQTVTVTAAPPPNSLLNGNFVILLTSNHSANGPYVLGGVISGDGNGTITNATFDVVDAAGNAGQAIHPPGPSTYSIGPNGQGQIHLLIGTALLSHSFGTTGPASPCGSTPNCGSLTLSVVFVTPQHAVLSESDSFGAATGTLDLQNIQSFVGNISPGVYTLSLSGSEEAPPNVGYFADSAVTIPPSGPYSYISDQSDGGVITSAPFKTYAFSFPSLVPFGPFYKLSSLNVGLSNQLNLDLWPIDSTHFVVTDTLDSFIGSPNVIISGHFLAQPAAPTISGTYAFTETGASATAQRQVAGGVLTCGSTGTLDVVPLSGTVLTNQAINATCGTVTNGRSLIAVTGASSSGINQFAAYPTVDQGLYLIELDGGASGTSGSSGAGVALQQTLSAPIASAALNGVYASNFSASTALGSQDFAAQIVADGVSALTGIGDVNSFDATAATPVGTPSLGAGFSGSYSSASDGRFPNTLTITPATGQPAPQVPNLNLACYLIDSKTCMLLGLNATAPGAGMLLLQNTGL